MRQVGSRVSIRVASVAAVLAFGAGTAFAQSAGQVFQQGGGPDFVVSMEAESYRTNTPGTGTAPHTWNLVSGSPTYMHALPDSGQNVNTGYTDPASGSCRLDFKVLFATTGAHYVWVRGRSLAGALVGSSDSCHVGLDWRAQSDSDRVNSFTDSWTWRRITMDGNNAQFNVPTTGVHTVNVWMREDGFRFDKILLTTNPAYAGVTDGGTMVGPAQSGQVATPAPVIVSPASPLGNGATGSPYSVTFQAIGSGPFTWSTTGTLPPGITLDPNTGVYSGSPTTVNTYTFTVTVTAAEGGNSGPQAYSHQIDPGSTGPPFITSPSSPLPDGEVDSFYSQIIYASGAALINWSISAGSMPPGMSLNPFGGNYDGTPTVVGTYTFTVRATNSQGFSERQYTHTITPVPSTPPTITGPSSPLPDWTENNFFSISFTASGTAPIAWSITSGTLPPGLTLDTAGGLSGSPTTPGDYSFLVTAENAGGSDTRAYTMRILPAAPTAPTISSPSSPLPPVTVGQPYEVQFAATGTPPFTWGTVGTLPPGITLDAGTGLYAGTPTTAGTYTFTVTCTNAVTPNASRNYTHMINAASPPGTAPAITGPSSPLSAGLVGGAYSTRFTATGTTPIAWNVTGGSLPPGITLNTNTGDYAGTATAGGTYTFTVTASNSVSPSASQGYSHFIEAASPPGTAPAITGPASPLAGGTVGTPYTSGITATGSTPLRWRVVSGLLPGGLSLNPDTGAYLGTPTVAGTSTFTVGVNNSVGPEATAVYSHTITGGAPTAPVITGPASPLPSGTEGTSYTVTFTATGSTPITWSMSATVPGLTLNASTGVLSGTPTTAGPYSFDVTASNGVPMDDVDPYSLTIVAAGAAPVITGPASPLTNGTVGSSYSATITATGATPITWSISGGTLTPGMALNPSTGVYSGTPSTAGTYSFTVRADNSLGFDTRAYQHTIVTPTVAPTITGPASPLSPGTAGSAYSTTFVATGTTPITWSVSAGSLPTGMGLNSSTGAYTGTPTVAGTYTFTIRATNAGGSDSDPYQHVINPSSSGAPAITGPASPLTDGTQGTPYSATFTATGTAPITWGFTGTLPPGLALDASTGAYTGTPTTAGTYNFTITATNAAGSDSDPYQHTIAGPVPPAITGPASPLSPGNEGTAYSAQFVATGTAPITWSVTSGSLPTGMSLNPASGAYSGTPTVAGTYTFTVTATNGGGSDSDPYQHVINAATSGPPVITGPASPLSDGTQGTPYSATFTAGGSPPIAWSIVGGTIPPGMSLNSTTGAYTGTPSAAGAYTFTVQALNGQGSVSGAYAHTVHPPGGPPPSGGGGGGGGGCGLTGLEALAAVTLLGLRRRALSKGRPARPF